MPVSNVWTKNKYSRVPNVQHLPFINEKLCLVLNCHYCNPEYLNSAFYNIYPNIFLFPGWLQCATCRLVGFCRQHQLLSERLRYSHRRLTDGTPRETIRDYVPAAAGRCPLYRIQSRCACVWLHGKEAHLIEHATGSNYRYILLMGTFNS